MNKAIIFTTGDWSDEFDYPIFSISTKEDIENLITKLEETKITEMEFVFGTNEWFEFSKSDVISILKSYKEVTDEELEVINKFTPKWLGVDIVSTSLDILTSLGEANV